jgi:hypothetical protein
VSPLLPLPRPLLHLPPAAVRQLLLPPLLPLLPWLPRSS